MKYLLVEDLDDRAAAISDALCALPWAAKSRAKTASAAVKLIYASNTDGYDLVLLDYDLDLHGTRDIADVGTGLDVCEPIIAARGKNPFVIVHSKNSTGAAWMLDRLITAGCAAVWIPLPSQPAPLAAQLAVLASFVEVMFAREGRAL